MHLEEQSSFSEPTTQWKFKVKLTYCEIWQNLYDNSVAEAYLLPTPFLQKEQKNYLERKGNGIVNCLGIVYINENSYVLIERITNRLTNLTILTESQSLKVLYSVYKALEEVDGVWDDFWLKENCICFNTAGDVKIWKNSELWNNHSQKTLLKGQRNSEGNCELMRRVFRMVEEKCINPLILEPFSLLRKNETTFEEGYNTAMKIGQKLFIDIGQIKGSERSTNNVFFCRKVLPAKTYPELGEKIKNFDSNKQKFQKNIEKTKYRELKTERKTISTHHSPIKQNSIFPHRNRGFSGYQTAQKENIAYSPPIDIKKYESSPASPEKKAFKKKNTEEKFQNCSKVVQDVDINSKKKVQDLQTFGVLEEKISEFKRNGQKSSKKESLIDVAKMQEELRKFSQKKKKFSVQKKRSSLENLTEDFTKIQQFTSTASGFLQLNARKVEHQDEDPVKNEDTIYNVNPSEKRQSKKTVKPFLKHYRKASNIPMDSSTEVPARSKTPTMREATENKGFWN